MRYENLSAVRKYELRTVRKTKREFKKEVDYLNHLLNMFLRTLKVIDEKVDAHREFTNSEKASFRLSFRIFRIIRYAFNSSLEGYYDVSMALLRIALENHLLQIYLGEHENEAKLWFKGKRFSPAFLRKNANWSKFFYRELSEFVHSSFESTFIFTRTEEGWEQGLLGEYNGEQFKNILFLMTIIFFFYNALALDDIQIRVCYE